MKPAGPVRVADVEVKPGTSARIELPVARLATQTHLSLPIAVVHGRHAGPRMWLSAVVHGDEIAGVEVIRRVLRRLRPASLRGTVIAVPVVNVFGFINQSRYLPDRRDLNRSFPGSPRGSLAGRLAHLFMTHVVDGCTHGIDLHTGSAHRRNLPQVRGNLADPEIRRIACAFGAPIMIQAKLRDGSLREAATRRGIATLLYEGGGPYRFHEDAVEIGVTGVLRVMSALGMGKLARPCRSACREAASSVWVRARRSGLFRTEVRLGAMVEAGQRLGAIDDALGDLSLPVRAPEDGLVIALAVNPLVSQGDALVHLARVEAAPAAG